VTQLAGHRRKTKGMFHHMAQIENDNVTHLIDTSATCGRLRRNRSLGNVVYFYLAFLGKKKAQVPKQEEPQISPLINHLIPAIAVTSKQNAQIEAARREKRLY
jgi:hypothetical protein